MPIIPNASNAPLDTVETVLEFARVRLNDMIQSIQGEVLIDTAPFSQTVFNMAWRQFCLFCGNLGATDFIDEVILFSLPPVTSTDPASQCYLDWSTYFDGGSYNNTPILPPTLLAPLDIWERMSNSAASFDCGKMKLAEDGLRTIPKTIRNYQWEWRKNKLFFPGSQQTEDFRIRFITNIQDFVNTGNPPQVGGLYWYQQVVPVPQCADSLSWFIAAEMSEPRGDVNADALRQKGEMAARIQFNRQVRREQRTTSRRQSYSNRGGRGYYEGY